jgi:tight adherence protein B
VLGAGVRRRNDRRSGRGPRTFAPVVVVFSLLIALGLAVGSPLSLGLVASAAAQTDETEADPTGSGADSPSPSPEAFDDGDRSIQIVEIDQSGYPRVELVVAVPPAFAGELSAGSFGLTESGRVMGTEVEKLREILEVVIVVDTSGSMSGAPIDRAKEAALDFVDSLDGDVAVAVVGFGDTASVEAVMSFDRDETRSAISGLSASGETSLYDGLVLSTGQFGDTARRFVVLLSDGNDTASSNTLGEATTALVDAGPKLYAITLASPEVEFAALEQLTAEVDGELVEASDEAQLSDVYSAVASRLTNLYRIRYQSRVEGEAPVVISVDVDGDLAVASEMLALGDEPLASPSGSANPDGETTTSHPQAGPPREAVVGDAGPMGSELALYIGAGTLFLVVAAALYFLMAREPSGPSAIQRLNLSAAMPRRSGLASVADRATAVADRILEKGSKRSALDSALERGGVEMRPGEFVAAAAGASLGMSALGLVLGGPLFGLGALAVALVGSRLVLSFKASRRQKRFADQLGDTLMMISGSMRAGHGIMESIDTVASQAESPTREEFSRAVTESRIGRDMIASLYDIADRTGSEDFIWVVRAISINRELGGDLAEILDNVGETIRDRNRLRDQVRALSAEGKVSAMILFSLPIFVAGWVKMSNPDYISAMTQETAGKAMLGLAVFEMVMGGIWLKKLVKVDF